MTFDVQIIARFAGGSPTRWRSYRACKRCGRVLQRMKDLAVGALHRHMRILWQSGAHSAKVIGDQPPFVTSFV